VLGCIFTVHLIDIIYLFLLNIFEVLLNYQDKGLTEFLEQVIVKSSNVYAKDAEAPPCGVDDMTKLAYLHEPGVLQNLKSRYDINEIYVSGKFLLFLGSLDLVAFQKFYTVTIKIKTN
jgi:hypothetical protein